MSPMSNEATRLMKNGVQALVAAGVAWAIAKSGVVIDDTTKLTDSITIIVFGLLMVVVPGLVRQLSKLPFIGPIIALLNGPRKDPLYVEQPRPAGDVPEQAI